MSVIDKIAQRTTAIVLAGGRGTRLRPLTRSICKPALPFGGAFRCIDFTLSNCVNSGVRTIGVATQYAPDALLAHLHNNWNAGTAANGAVVHAWRAEERAARFGYCGTADAVYRNLPFLPHSSDSLVLVLAGDHVYRMDYRPMLEAHCARNAVVTIGCVHVPLAEARHFGIMAVSSDGRIERFVEKPASPGEVPTTSDGRALASMGIYVFDAPRLAEILDADAAMVESSHDFGADILPRLIDGGRAYSHAFSESSAAAPGYWRDIGTLRAYWQAHMDLLEDAPPLALDDPRWPLCGQPATLRARAASTPTADGGRIEQSIVSPSGTVAGQLSRSVVCAAVEIGRGAKVSECVVLPGAVVGAGSRLHGVIVDAGYRVPDGTIIEQRGPYGEPPVLSTHHAAQTARYAATR